MFSVKTIAIESNFVTLDLWVVEPFYSEYFTPPNKTFLIAHIEAVRPRVPRGTWWKISGAADIWIWFC